VAQALEDIIDRREVEGHELQVQVLKADGPTRSCHVLYLAGRVFKQTPQLIERLYDAPVLTVSDAERFADVGGITQLVTEGDRMRLVINLKAAQRARLNVSSKLLALARVVRG
jgi:hypothetical protein